MFGVFKKNREKEITDLVGSLSKKIMFGWQEFTPSEQVDILKRLNLQIFSAQKKQFSEALEQARELQKSIKEINLK